MVKHTMVIQQRSRSQPISGRKKKNAMRSKRTKAASEAAQLSFAEVEKWEIPPIQGNAVEIDALPSPIWTETKAQLIANYLHLFLLITKHGVYIDGFSGPQDKGNPDSWAAKLVLELSPPWMKSFFLCELSSNSYGFLTSMIEAHPKVPGRQINHKLGDFNQWIDEILKSPRITDKTASFALLDQRSTECHWSTVQKLAAHKRGTTKIELFYFFPTGWVHRAISETKDESKLNAWWGDDGWRQVQRISQDQAPMLYLKKIQALGYRDVKSWPISAREGGTGRTMYHMIHATDHLEAPRLMYRAYRDLIGNIPAGKQTQLTFDTPPK
jgi:three-Cys-motif partner protein